MPTTELLIKVVDDFNRIEVVDYTKILIQEKQEQEQKSRQKKLIENPLMVTGIMGGERPMAVIGEEIYHEGDKINNVTIHSIGSDFVEFLDDKGSTFRKRVGE